MLTQIKLGLRDGCFEFGVWDAGGCNFCAGILDKCAEAPRCLLTAEALRGSHCLVAEADLPEGFDAARSREYDLHGFAVDDGRLGRIAPLDEKSEMPASDRLVVEGASGRSFASVSMSMPPSREHIARWRRFERSSRIEK